MGIKLNTTLTDTINDIKHSSRNSIRRTKALWPFLEEVESIIRDSFPADFEPSIELSLSAWSDYTGNIGISTYDIPVDTVIENVLGAIHRKYGVEWKMDEGRSRDTYFEWDSLRKLDMDDKARVKVPVVLHSRFESFSGLGFTVRSSQGTAATCRFKTVVRRIRSDEEILEHARSSFREVTERVIDCGSADDEPSADAVAS